MKHKSELYTTKQLAEKLGWTDQTIRNWYKQGKIRVAMITPGGRLLFDLDEVQEDLKPVRQNNLLGE